MPPANSPFRTGKPWLSSKPLFSLEVFPPKRTAPIGTIYDTLDGLHGVDPAFISVTYGTGKQSDRTITARIANTIRTEYGIPAVAHLTAQYLDRDQADEALDMFAQAKVAAVLALRGDRNPEREPAGVFMHASDLTRYIRQTHPEMTVYGACYPECHPQSRDLDEDISWLKVKVDAGASHLILPAVLRQRRLPEVPGQGARRRHRRADRGRHHAGDQRRVGPAHDRHVLLQGARTAGHHPGPLGR